MLSDGMTGVAISLTADDADDTVDIVKKVDSLLPNNN